MALVELDFKVQNPGIKLQQVGIQPAIHDGLFQVAMAGGFR
jgi:hypothetical protein